MELPAWFFYPDVWFGMVDLAEKTTGAPISAIGITGSEGYQVDGSLVGDLHCAFLALRLSLSSLSSGVLK
jgi:hypothetical protein